MLEGILPAPKVAKISADKELKFFSCGGQERLSA